MGDGGSGSSSGGYSGASDYQNDFTGAWDVSDVNAGYEAGYSKNVAGDLAKDVATTGTEGKDYSKDSLAADSQRGVDRTTSIDKALDAAAPITGMINPMLGLLTKVAGMFYSPDTHQQAAIKAINGTSYSNPMSIPNDGQNRGNSSGRGQSIQSKITPTINQIPNQASEIAAKAPTTADTDFNPEEAAEAAVEDERKKARQRVGLMQMRAVDPLFIENLPSIFRSRAY